MASDEALMGGKRPNYGKPLTEENVRSLPLSFRERKCTNIPFCVLFIAFWAGMGYIAIEAVHRAGGIQGYQRLVNGQQWDGQICGLGSLKGEKFLFWPVETEPNMGVCVASCPTGTSGNVTVNGINFPTYKTNVLYHYCTPADALDNSAIKSEINKLAFSHVVADLGKAWPVLLGSAGIALTAGFIYLLLLQWTAGCLVWIVITLIIAGFGVGGYALFTHGKSLPADAQGKAAMTYIGIGLFVADAIFILIICALRKSIVTAVELLKEACRAVQDMKRLLLLPPVKFIFVLGLMAYWCSVAVYIGSAGTRSTESYTVPGTHTIIPVTKMAYSNQVVYAFLYHFFGLLWTAAFIVAIGDLTIAGAVSKWYFTPTVDGDRDVIAPMRTSLYNTFRFHMGSAAFGSFVLAIIGMIRWFLKYVHSKLHGKSGETKLLKVVLCACMCCVHCFERIVKFLGRHAYIQVALFGYGFCEAARTASMMMLRNAGRVASISMLGWIFLMLGQLLVTAITGLSCYALLQKFYSGPDGVSSPILPTVLASIIGWVVGGIFSQVFDMSVNTILHCYVADVEAHSEEGGPPRTQFASERLAKHTRKK